MTLPSTCGRWRSAAQRPTSDVLYELVTESGLLSRLASDESAEATEQVQNLNKLFRIVSRIVYGHDFYEGVRAVIVDKDNAPRWKPAALADAADADVERHFASLAADELVLP